jgi:Zn-dependent protease with chaperone function
MSDERDSIKAVFGQTPPKDPADDAPKKPELVDRIHFQGISPRAWEHPADRAALTALRKVPALDTVLRRMFGLINERALRLLYLANAVQVTDQQFSRVHAIYQDCLKTLDAETTPELFIAQTPIVNAGAVGIDNPFIVLNSGTLELLDDDELRFVIGHELGHALSGHVLYKTMLHVLLRVAPLHMFPRMLLMGLIMALREWDRKSELSCDRAGLLCLQDPMVAYRVHMKMAGGSRTDEMSVAAFIAQAKAYEEGGDVRDGALKFLNLLGRTHPFPVLRLAELKKWVDDGEYRDILAGNYPRRGEDASAVDDVAEGARSYKASMDGSADPFVSAVRDFGSNLGEEASALWDQVRNLFGGRGKDEPPADDEPEPEPDDNGPERRI